MKNEEPDARKVFDSFFKKIKNGLWAFPRKSIWTHNILSLFSEIGKDFDYIPTYEKKRIDCTWHSDEESVEEKTNIKLAVEYEDYIDDDKFGKVLKDVKKLRELPDYCLRVIVYYLETNTPPPILEDMETINLKVQKTTQNWLIIQMGRDKSREKLIISGFTLKEGEIKLIKTRTIRLPDHIK